MIRCLVNLFPLPKSGSSSLDSLSMRAHQTKKTSVQIAAINPTGHSMASPAFHFWPIFPVDRSIGWKASLGWRYLAGGDSWPQTC